jgi:hypothetical protein
MDGVVSPMPALISLEDAQREGFARRQATREREQARERTQQQNHFVRSYPSMPAMTGGLAPSAIPRRRPALGHQQQEMLEKKKSLFGKLLHK